MSTEIAVRAASLPEKMQYAEALAFSFMLPEQYRKQPANVLWAIEYGETIGITAMAAITGVHMIEGKPTASAALISGLVRRAGHKLRSGYDATTRTGWAEIVRCDDPDFTFRSEWNVDRAIEAELVQLGPKGELIAKDSKGRSKPWKKFYPSMTKARAITEVARDACEEVLFGLHYTPEELGADTDDEGNLVVRAARAAFVAQDDPWQTPAPAAEAKAADANVEYAEEVETAPLPPPAPGVPTVTPEQLDEIAQLLKVKRNAFNGDRNRIISELVRRPVKDVRTLSQAEARSIIETLTAEPDLIPLPDTSAPAPEPTGAPARGVTEAQKKMIWGTINRQGHTHAGGHVLMSRILDREITSTDQLSIEDGSTVINALGTGEIPAASGPSPSDEGISVVDALQQIIDDAHTEDEFDQARADIEREHAEGGISGEQLAALQAQWINRRNEQQAKVGASA